MGNLRSGNGTTPAKTPARGAALRRARSARPENGRRPTNDLYQRIVDAIVDYAILMLDPEGIVVTWNRGAENLKQYRASEIVGKHFSVFYVREDLERGKPQRELQEAAASGRFEDEGWRVRKDGTRFWANVVLTAQRDPRGRLLGFSKVTRDLSERRQAEEMQQRYRQMVDAVYDYEIILLDPEGKVLTWNAGAEKLKGYRAEEVIGTSFTRFYTPEDLRAGRPDHELRTAAAQGRVEDKGWRVRKDGSRFWANAIVTALRDKSGQLIGYAKIARDLTERQQIENQLVATVREASLLLARGVSHIHTSSPEPAARASEQSAAVRQTVATVDELVHTAEQAAIRARTVVESDLKSLEIGLSGRRSLDEST
jgi:PAS domain S-box-containing protein